MSDTFKVMKNGRTLGVITRATGALNSADPTLTALYRKWETEGFRVLGPAEGEVPAGVMADALLTVKPGPDNLGLVAIELGNHGYDLEF